MGIEPVVTANFVTVPNLRLMEPSRNYLHAIGAGEFGNAIRGPLGIHRGANRRFWFYGADYTLEDQIAYLNRLRKVTEEELRRFIAGKERPEPAFPPPPSGEY